MLLCFFQQNEQMIYYIIILMCCFLFVSFLSCSILIQQKTSKSIAGFEPSNHSGESRKVFQTSNCAGELLVFREGIQYTYMHTYIHTYHTIPYHTIPYHTIPYHTIPYHTMLSVCGESPPLCFTPTQVGET